MPQEFAQPTRSSEQGAEERETTSVEPSAQAGDELDVLDAVLDDIESTLEANAQEYVNSFVQKGGQ